MAEMGTALARSLERLMEALRMHRTSAMCAPWVASLLAIDLLFSVVISLGVGHIREQGKRLQGIISGSSRQVQNCK